MTARWYVVNVYSGSEKKVADSIKEQAVQKKLEDKILDVLVPMETIVDTKKSLKKGEKVNAERKFFPGYILVKMEMTDESQLMVQTTPRVSGFLGGRNKPQPISNAEVERIMHQITEGLENP
ncbi:MAG: transcription termination/antitermination protein NusG, partial [Alphaproteobacteria bacterium]|nr:transcription termination/antitermination protein NusG [Alphaproteobacteria bacterium]